MIEGFGWRAACGALGILLLVVLAPINLLLRRRPKDVGLEPDGDALGPNASAPQASNIVDEMWVAIDWTLWRAMRRARFWWIALAYFAGLCACYAAQVHQTKYLIDIGSARPSRRGRWTSSASSAIPESSARPHFRSDRQGMGLDREQPGLASCFAALILLETHLILPLLHAMIRHSGRARYGLTSIFGAIVAEIYAGKHYGSILGTLMLAAITGGELGPWATGALYDLQGPYVIAFWICVGRIALSVLAL